MRVVCQRVESASVKVEKNIVGSIQKGYLLYIGFTLDDDMEIVEKMAHKISKLRIFEDGFGKLNLNLEQVKGDILAISQFTLYGDVKGNHRPSFTKALNPKEAKALYDAFVLKLSESFHVETGIFQAHMQVSSINDGPVTILIEY
jgi:D-tyrosyl-tRNA(Tyr) deacylase